jgi:hypothetical protein
MDQRDLRGKLVTRDEWVVWGHLVGMEILDLQEMPDHLVKTDLKGL